MVTLPWRVELKSVGMVCGGPCVMTSGAIERLKWFAENLDTWEVSLSFHVAIDSSCSCDRILCFT